jgi:hypothetical protein
MKGGMMKKPIHFKTFFTLLLILFSIISCSLPGPKTVEKPTDISQGIVKTFSAQISATATHATPTSTVTDTPIPPTLTVSLTPTNTATPRPTLTPLPPQTGCQVNHQSPYYKQHFGPGADFDATWTLENTGFESWDPDTVDFRYLRGYKFQKNTDIFNFKSAVRPQNTVDIRVDMLAPRETGEFTSVWALMDNGNLLCAVMIDLIISP